MIDQTLTTPPDAPSSNDIPTFRTRFDAFIAWIVTFVSQLTTVISQINSTASTINSKESSATSAASTATTQAGIATTKASEANASAIAAYNAQLAAEAVFDNFDDKYLGAKATAPTVDNDGNPLVTGALFFKTTSPKGIYVYDAELSIWSSPTYVPTSHGSLSGRSDTDSHPISAITGLVDALADKLSKTLDASIDGIKTFLKSPIVPTPTAGDNSQKVATTAFVQGEKVKGLLAEYVVTGSPITSIDFSNLDINTHKSYRVEISIANATANSSGLYCFINGDTNLTNYYRELVQFDGTTIGANRANNPQIITLQPSSSLSLTSNVQRGDNGYARAINFGNSSNGSSVLKEDSTLIKTATVANITQLTFTTSVAGAIAVGSKIRIYRGDV